MWDRGEPDGYANHMTTDPLPDTPAHKVLIEMAYGDHQVANVATEVEARTIGAPLRQPALDPDRLPPGFDQPFFAPAHARALSGPAADGSGMFIWDIGPKRGRGAGDDPRHRPAADHQHRAERLLRRRPARHRDQHLAADPRPDRELHQPAGHDHRPVRPRPLLRGGLDRAALVHARPRGRGSWR